MYDIQYCRIIYSDTDEFMVYYLEFDSDINLNN